MTQSVVTKGEKLYEGKAKQIYATSDPSLVIQYFKDDATAFNGKKKGIISNKGVCNNTISSHIFSLLEKEGVKTHFVEKLSDREMLVKKVGIIPVEVVMRNVTAGSLSTRMGVPEGEQLPEPVLEFYYKNDELGDPMINKSHIRAFRLATDEEMATVEQLAFRVNKWLLGYFDRMGIRLVDYKLEFGRSPEGVLLADEISPDGCRLWDKATGEKMDKDRFRRDLGMLTEVYEEMARRALATV
ncbi:MAG: phosphoribosylaminoimidazolesuccinocarboxamide synthase [Nitrospinae bacterium]|nr:phosphoribosylaminoimidazolesuccinocarboxamide synthase [Nitrospinota bacterium]